MVCVLPRRPERRNRNTATRRVASLSSLLARTARRRTRLTIAACLDVPWSAAHACLAQTDEVLCTWGYIRWVQGKGFRTLGVLVLV